MKHLLELKKRMNARRPEFIRQDAHKWKRLGTKWRKPTGIHSKVRQKIAGHPVMVDVGYRSPVATRGMLRSGLRPVLVHNANQLECIDSKKQCAVIAATVGTRKKLMLMELGKKKGVNIINITIDSLIERVKKKQDKAKSVHAQTREKSEKKLEEKAKDETTKEETTKEETTKEEQRLEAEKIIIKA